MPDPPTNEPERPAQRPARPRPLVSFGPATDNPPDRRQGVGGASLAAGGGLDEWTWGRESASLRRAVQSWTSRPTVRALHRRRGGPRRRLDVPATIRAARRTGGQVWRIVLKPRRQRPPGLVVAWDVSGSMSDQIRYYGAWLAGLVHHRADVRVFAFGAEWADVTDALARTVDVRGALAQFEHWGGGTAIGQALMAVVASNVLRPSTRVVIVSDGWEAAPPEQLAQALARVKNVAGRVVWLNPLMALPGYQPIQRGIRVAHRYVDRMAAGATYEDLARIGMTEVHRD